MSTKYIVDPFSSAKIRALECVKETAKFAWLTGFYFCSDKVVQKKKDGDVFDTWAEAHAELTRRAEAQVVEARRALQVAQGIAGNVKGMKPPTTTEGPK